MYTILPIHQEKMPRSFLFDSVEEASESAVKDFNDPHTPETKGYMVVKIEKAVGVTRSINEDVSIEDYIQAEQSTNTKEELATEEA